MARAMFLIVLLLAAVTVAPFAAEARDVADVEASRVGPYQPTRHHLMPRPRALTHPRVPPTHHRAAALPTCKHRPLITTKGSTVDLWPDRMR